MAMDGNRRYFKLVVQEVGCNVIGEQTAEDLGLLDCEDYVEIVYAGKVYPSTRKRIAAALDAGHFEQNERRMA